MTAVEVLLPFTGDPERTCAYCGREEPNEYLHTINHGSQYAGARLSGECTAMNLTRNHVVYDVGQVEQARWQLENAGHKQLAKRRDILEHAQASLRRSLTRVREVWPDLVVLHADLAQHDVTSARITEALS